MNTAKFKGYEFRGGEREGLKRLEEYIFGTKSISHYAKTRNALDGLNFASKLSPWIANGTLSIRKVYHEALRFEKEFGHEASVKKFIDELFWRDFARFYCLKNGTKIFFEYGVSNRGPHRWETDQNKINKWCQG